MDSIPHIHDFLEVAPMATVVIVVAGIGWWARGVSSNQTINLLKEFIDFLKNRNIK